MSFILLYKHGGDILNNTLVGLNIKQARKTKKMTHQQLATAIDKTESSIRKYENGSIEVPNSVLEQIATALDTNLSALIGIEAGNKYDRQWNFEKSLESIGYIIFRDDPEHKPSIKTSSGEGYSLEYGDLEKFMETSEAITSYTIDTILKKRQKIK